MKRFRILTTDDEWLYTDLNVLDNCIRCPLMDENGTQVTDPRVRLKPETFGELMYREIFCICRSHFYEGDIVKVRGYEDYDDILLENELMRFVRTDCYGCILQTINRSSPLQITSLYDCHMKLVGNIHQNPELLEE